MRSYAALVYQVQRDTTVRELREALVQVAQRPLASIALRLHGVPLEDDASVEGASLFGCTSELEVLLR